MTDFDYKKYSLDNLKNWMHDAMSSGEATAQEIYDAIIEVVQENQQYHRKNERNAFDLLSLLKGHRQIYFDDTISGSYFGTDVINSAGNDLTGITFNCYDYDKNNQSMFYNGK